MIQTNEAGAAGRLRANMTEEDAPAVLHVALALWRDGCAANPSDPFASYVRAARSALRAMTSVS